MKKKKIILCFVVLTLIFGVNGLVFGGGGGPEDPACPDPLPDPDSGKFLRGEFTVARDKGQCTVSYPEICAHYNIHVWLKWGNQTHLFSFTTSLGTGNLCDYTADELKETFKRRPCNMEVGAEFGLLGVPVIASLDIAKSDFCGTLDEMIKGEIVIRVVSVE